MELNHDVHFVADGLANLLEGHQRRYEVGTRNVVALSLDGRRVEWPDLHSRDAFGEKFEGKFVRSVEKTIQVIEVLDTTAVPIVDVGVVFLNVLRTSASVVG